jgi:phosphomannomutase
VQNAYINAQAASPEILELLKELRKKAVIGFIGGSNLVKITEQLGNSGQKEFPRFT